MDGEKWISDNIPTNSFLLEVDFEEDLTDSHISIGPRYQPDSCYHFRARDTHVCLCT
jgi:hypothetical protein